MDDWQLLEAWRRGDKASGEALLGRYMGLLARFFRNKVNNPADVSDLISETMLVCTKSKGNVRNSGAFRSFLFSSAMNVLRGHYRKKVKRGREYDDFANICVGDPSDLRSLSSMVAQKEEGQLLVRALRRLRLDHQIVLELHYVEGLSAADIAEMLAMPKPTVYTRLRRGLEKLRVVMGEMAEDERLIESTMTGLRTWAAEIRDGIDS